MNASKLSPAVVQDLCKRYSNQKIDCGIELLSYSLKSANDATTGFLGRHEILSVIFQKNSSDAPQELIFFIKTAPTNIASKKKYIEEFGVFKKEISVYANLLPKLQQKELSDFSARCYYAQDDILVFEHLGEMGYRMGADRSGLLDFEHLKCALSSLASMHASSIIFEASNHQSICEMFPEIVNENSYPSDPNSIRRENFNYAVLALCEIIKVMPEFKDNKNLEYILTQFPQVMNKIFNFVKSNTKYLNVFSHGDLWSNNLLFKYENERPVHCRIVDFQLTRYAPPIFDVITVLTIPTTKKFRLEHLDSLLNSYYSMLGYFLKQHGYQINDFLSQEQFEDSIREFKVVGLIESCLFSHLTVLPNESTEDINSSGFEEFFKNKRNEICLMAFNSDVIYRNRLSDMISDIVNSYILN